VVPLARDAVEIGAYLVERFGFEREPASRPTLTARTTPAPSSTRRCLVTAWRVRRVPSVSRAIERGSPSTSLASSNSRVSSPSAANTAALDLSCAASLRGIRFVEVPGDVLELDLPTLGVLGEHHGAAMRRHAGELSGPVRAALA
jgi:hypothetical protein